MSNYLVDIEDAVITKVNSAKRPDDNTRNFFNRVDIFRGEKAEVFLAIARETAPSAWLRLDRILNKPEEFRGARAFGRSVTHGTLRNEIVCVWSVFLCARSLRATKELSHGGPGVIGAYDMINLVVGSAGSPPTTPGQLRGWSPTANAEPFIFVGLELLGQTTTETVYESQFRTRVQL
jgi:hypothetical protein